MHNQRLPLVHRVSPEEALRSLHSSEQGLSDEEARRRLAEFGPNAVARLPGQPLWRRLQSSFANFFALILWLAAALALIAARQQPGEGMGVLAAAILGVIFINGAFSFWQEHRAERAIAELEKLLPHRVQVMRDGHVAEIDAQGLVPGDVILLEEGDDVAADCRALEAVGLRVSNATITGESAPVDRDARPSDAEHLSSATNVLLAGTSVVSGRGRALVFATGMRTEFGRIAELAQVAHEVLSPLQKEILRLSRLLAALAVALGVMFFALGVALGIPFWDNVLFGIGIIVANVPEGLLPTVTLALAMGSQRMAKRNVLIRHLPSVETLGAATVICTDKTGTLTQNRMVARRVIAGGREWDAHTETAALGAAPGAGPLLAAARLCHDLHEVEVDGRPHLTGDPMEIALVDLARHAQRWSTSPDAPPRVDEVPFDSERRRLSTLHRGAAGLVLYTKGALEALLPLSTQLQEGDETVSLTDEARRRLLRAEEAMAAAGLRVLAFAYRPVHDGPYERAELERDLILTGLVGLEDPPRPEVATAIATCGRAGIRVIMTTGDHPRTAAAIAAQIGMPGADRPTIITGDRLHRMSDTELQVALRAPGLIFARLLPEQKMRIVTALQRRKEVVAVTGDGVNDAPALRAADIGVAMGRTGTDVARAAADIVITDDNFASIVNAVEEGRAVFANIRKFMTYILTSNVPEIVPYLAFVLLKIPLPLTIVQILAVDLGTDMLPALALGAEPPRGGLMDRPPRSRSERLLDWPLLRRAYLWLGLLEATAAMAAFFFVLHGGGWIWGQAMGRRDPLYLAATTACLAAIVVAQVANLLVCRSETEPAFPLRLGQNRLIAIGIAAELALMAAIVYTPVGNLLLGTAPLPIEAWLFMIPFALAMLGLEEIRKALVRARARAR